MPLTLLLVLVFWLPPYLIGRSSDSPHKGVLIVPAWAFIWLVLSILSMPPYDRPGPADPGDAQAYAAIGLAALALIMVLPGSAIAFWIGMRQPRPRFSLRTLVIFTTLVSVVLGIAVYVARR